MKRPDEVGKDFDAYVREWSEDGYSVGSSPDGSASGTLTYPGDEWGEVAALVDLYRPLFQRLQVDKGPVNVLEIGAGGGRATVAVLEVLGDRIGDYHVIDVSSSFVEVLTERVSIPVSVHIVDDVDMSGLPLDHFDLCLAQSSWSHIGLYDQYRYLRELRPLLRYQAPLIVHGQFMLGTGDEWTWNRFLRRIYQIDHDVQGVFHEFTGVNVLVEQLARLEYEIEVIHKSGFVARRFQANRAATLVSEPLPTSFPHLASIHRFASGVEPDQVPLL
jgi:SAM-dependent methyltransferase